MCERAFPLPPNYVLVVDDCADSNATWSTLLHRWGFTAEVARDGETAVQIASRQSPAAVLLDIVLPGIDGYEVARRIRALKGPRPLLIALTAVSQPLDLIAASEADFDLHIIKPADPESIRHILDCYCKDRLAQANVSPSASEALATVAAVAAAGPETPATVAHHSGVDNPAT